MNSFDWLSIPPDQLRHAGLARLSLAIASGLPASVSRDSEQCHRVFEDLARIVSEETQRHFRTARHLPEQRDLSEAQFRMLSLVTTLRRGLQIHYNQLFMEGEYDDRDSCNLFLHGILSGRGGTCATLPLLYTAIGRALGYPLFLVQAKGHALCRWEEERGERFNIEATTYGYQPRDDLHFLRGERAITPEEMASGAYLRNTTPHQEVAHLLAERGICWLEHLQLAPALEALEQACQLHPEFPPYRTLRDVTRVLSRASAGRDPDLREMGVEDLETRTDLVAEFGSQPFRIACRDLRRITMNWKTRPPFPAPDFSIPQPVSPS